MKTKYFALIGLLVMSLIATSCTATRDTDLVKSYPTHVTHSHEVKPVFEL